MALAMRLPVGIRRWGYRFAYHILRVYWFIRRPQANGIKCVLTRGDGVLLVRHSYGRPEWEIPGGKIKAREQAGTAAAREMREELGVAIDDWRPLGLLTGRAEHRHDRLHCFQAELDSRTLTVDRGEIAAVAWFPRRSLPPELGGYVRPILALLDNARNVFPE
jgi:8-oxo-dGTP pyrophosphatase MutT (NUDIX family)